MSAEPLLHAAARRLAREYGLDLAAIGETVLGTALAEWNRDADALATADGIAALFNALPVGLSWFDRDRAQLRSAAAWAAARQRPLRVLSAPCARGEEVWSLAGALIDAGIAPGAVQILGIDAMPAAIEQAERGDYPAPARAAGADPLPWWLADHAGRWVVNARLRPMARFRVANLLDPDVLDGVRYDLILSRNFLIYLTPEARTRWVRALAGQLAANGRLYTAAGEPISAWSTAFAAVPGEVAGAWSRATTAASEPVPSVIAVRRSIAPARPRTPAPVEAGCLDTGPKISAPLPSRSDPRALADAGELVAAEALLAVRLSQPVPAAEDLVTAGLIALARGAGPAAEAAFRRALFLDHRHVEAATLLAALLDQRGDAIEAGRLRRRTGGAR